MPGIAAALRKGGAWALQIPFLLALKTAVTVPSLLWCTGAIALGRSTAALPSSAVEWLVLVLVVGFVVSRPPSQPRSHTT